MVATGWVGWLGFIRRRSSLSRVQRLSHTDSQGMANNPPYTRNGNTQVPFKFLIANMFANILLAKSNYMVESRIRAVRTTKLEGGGCNLARLLTGAVRTIGLPPGLHSQGLWLCCLSLLPTILVLLRELLIWLPTLITESSLRPGVRQPICQWDNKLSLTPWFCPGRLDIPAEAEFAAPGIVMKALHAQNLPAAATVLEAASSQSSFPGNP